MSKVLVTGGAGYIGSHTVLHLIESGVQPVIVDNFEKGYHEALSRINAITGKTYSIENADLRDQPALDAIFTKHPDITSVIHFAAYKDVGEAEKNPQLYYHNNVFGTLNLLNSMISHNVKGIVFSSTSAIYGDSLVLPMHEVLPIQPKNAYGRSKATVEWALDDFSKSVGLKAIALRYFNAAGAHSSGQIGEDPRRCGNIIPLIMQTLIGRRESFNLYGDQFDTADGTQERDYIHVSDLASGHLAALNALDKIPGFEIINLGTGKSTSNKKLIELAENISGKKLSYQIIAPRAGDPAITVSDPAKAKHVLGWSAQYGIEEIIKDQWNWVSKNPDGYSM